MPSQDERHLNIALDLFQEGVVSLHRIREGSEHVARLTIDLLQHSLEFVTETTDLELWIEVHLALAEAYAFCREGDLLENARLAIMHYQRALVYSTL